MPSNLPKEVELTLEIEGGYVNHPEDPGGETKYGISKRVYPHLDITSLTREEAGMILKRDYYDALRLSEVQDDSVRWKLLDMAVNMGQLRAKLYAQRALNVDVDGIFGPATMTALNLIAPARIMMRLIDICVTHYTNIVTRNPAKVVFLAGWMKRAVKRLEA